MIKDNSNPAGVPDQKVGTINMTIDKGPHFYGIVQDDGTMHLQRREQETGSADALTAQEQLITNMAEELIILANLVTASGDSIKSMRTLIAKLYNRDILTLKEETAVKSLMMEV